MKGVVVDITAEGQQVDPDGRKGEEHQDRVARRRDGLSTGGPNQAPQPTRREHGEPGKILEGNSGRHRGRRISEARYRRGTVAPCDATSDRQSSSRRSSSPSSLAGKTSPALTGSSWIACDFEAGTTAALQLELCDERRHVELDRPQPVCQGTSRRRALISAEGGAWTATVRPAVAATFELTTAVAPSFPPSRARAIVERRSGGHGEPEILLDVEVPADGALAPPPRPAATWRGGPAPERRRLPARLLDGAPAPAHKNRGDDNIAAARHRPGDPRHAARRSSFGHGYERVTSPTFDRLAERSYLFRAPTPPRRGPCRRPPAC